MCIHSSGFVLSVDHKRTKKDNLCFVSFYFAQSRRDVDENTAKPFEC